MEPGIAILLLVFGLPCAIWPYELARFSEQLDSIGSRRSWSEVEPADWNVSFTRIVGIGMALVGVLGLLAA